MLGHCITVTQSDVRGLPTVDVSIVMPLVKWMGRDATDDYIRAEIAFAHFRQKGLKHFASYDAAIGRYSPVRAMAFRNVVRKHGFQCDLFTPLDGKYGWEIDHNNTLQWLSILSRPLAMFAADPYPARQIAGVCEWNQIPVPDEISILSGDNDDMLCDAFSPHISSIQLASGKIGTELQIYCNR